ncbi:dephospho-CoA kinase [Aquirufa sp. ROCK-SH2]
MSKSLPPIIGITGGIGSGKSIICRIFSCLGIPVLEADKIAIQLIEGELKNQVLELLGNDAFDSNGRYQRNWVRKKVMENAQLLSELNEIVHPAVRKQVEIWKNEKSTASFKIYESALLTSKNKPAFVEKILAIECPLEERITNIQRRNNYNLEETMKIIQVQPSEKEYQTGADFIIHNNKKTRIWPQIEAIFKKMSLLMLILGMFITFSSLGQIKAMTFNIRMDTESDGVNQWKNRIVMCGDLIKYHQADIIGMQEAFVHQIKDVQKVLPQHIWFGNGRDDGKEEGEFSPIFYNKNKYKVLIQKTFWLSDSCEKVGFGWDAACRRVVTWGHFQEIKSGKKFFVFNTHFDHLGKIARRESAKLVLKKIKEIAQNSPTILLGDFNASPDDEPIQILVDENNPDKIINSSKISRNGHYGPIGSFNGFKSEREKSEIDYIFVKNGIKCLQHSTHSETWNNRYPSDHFPVSATLILP